MTTIRFFTKMYSQLEVTQNSPVKRKLMCAAVKNVANKFCTDFKAKFIAN